MNGSSTRFRRLMLLLGDPSRYALVRALDAGSRCVTDLALEVRLSQSCTTRHLQALEREQVVRRVRAGKRVFYDLRRDDPLVTELLAFGDRDPARLRDALFLYTDVAASTDSKPAPEPAPAGPVGLTAAAPEPPPPVEDPPAPQHHRSDIEDYLL